jgi:hypothetical protein
MANYFNAGISEVAFLADEDLTSWQYRLVMAASTVGYVQKYDILPTAASPRFPLGVLMNDPSSGQEASVKVIGFTKAVGLVATCYLSHGALLSPSDGGQFVAASEDASDHVAGIWFGPNVTSGSAYGNVLLNPFPASGAQILSSVN